MPSRHRVALYVDESVSNPFEDVVTALSDAGATVISQATECDRLEARLRVDAPVPGVIDVTDASHSASLLLVGEFDPEDTVLPMGRYALAVFDGVDVRYAVVGDWPHGRFERAFTVESALTAGRLKLFSSSFADDVGRDVLERAPACGVETFVDGDVALYDPPGVRTSDEPGLVDHVAGRFGPAVDAGGAGVRLGCASTSRDVFDQLDALDGWNPSTALAVLVSEGARAVEWLTDRLDAGSPRVEASALRTLARLRYGVGSRNTKLARKHEREGRTDDRDEAILAAGRAIGHPETDTPPTRIVERLDHPHPTVRAAAAWSLAGDEALAHPDELLGLCGDPDERVRAGVAVALAKARGVRDVSVVDLLRGDDAWLVRATAAWGLEVYRDAWQAIRPLGLALRDDPHPRVRAAAADALVTYVGVYDVSRATLGEVARRVFETDDDDVVRAAALRMGKYGLTVGEVAALVDSGGWVLEREVATTLSEGANAARYDENPGAVQFRENARDAVGLLVDLLDHHNRRTLRKAAERCLRVAMTRELAIDVAGFLDDASKGQRTAIVRAVRDAWDG
jgi:HEAT repeat protein